MRINILDHGYVEFIEAYGTGRAGRKFENTIDIPLERHDYECGIVEAARQSTQGAFRGRETDQKLLTSLYNNRPPHSGPFEFAGMIIEVQAPLFVLREWHRHRTQSYAEMSARYAPPPDLYYEPAVIGVLDRARRAQLTKNKQLQGLKAGQHPLNDTAIGDWVKEGWFLNETLEQHYQEGLGLGVPKELARIHMPVNHYSRMRASANLRNWLAFMTLRCDEGVQWETQQYAWAVAQCIQGAFPRTSSLWAAKHQREQVPVAWICTRVNDVEENSVCVSSDCPEGEGWTPLYAR